MSEMSYLIAQLHAAVPGIGPHAAPTDVLHATIAYVHAVQLAVGMRDTAARQYVALLASVTTTHGLTYVSTTKLGTARARR
jgi:hypothetical protein